MEEHKRKNKKRNQNKRPTIEQIKKIQRDAQQRNDNVINNTLNENVKGGPNALIHINDEEMNIKNRSNSIKVNGYEVNLENGNKNTKNETQKNNGKDKKINNNNKKKNKQKDKVKDVLVMNGNNEINAEDNIQETIANYENEIVDSKITNEKVEVLGSKINFDDDKEKINVKDTVVINGYTEGNVIEESGNFDPNIIYDSDIKKINVKDIILDLEHLNEDMKQINGDVLGSKINIEYEIQQTGNNKELGISVVDIAKEMGSPKFIKKTETNNEENHIDGTISTNIQKDFDKIEDFKVKFDVQKHISPMMPQIRTSNQAFFYKGFNQTNLEINENCFSSDEIIIENERSTDENSDTQTCFDSVEIIQKLPNNMFPNVNSIRNFTGNTDFIQAMASMRPLTTKSTETRSPFDQIFESLTLNEEPSSNELLYNMKNLLTPPTELLKKIPPPNDLFKQMFESINMKNTNKEEVGQHNAQTLPCPIEIQKQLQPPNEIFKQIYERSEIEDRNEEPSKKGGNLKINEMLNSLDAIAKTIDPNVLDGMNNMVASLLQDKGLQNGFQNLIQNQIQKEKIEEKFQIMEDDRMDDYVPVIKLEKSIETNGIHSEASNLQKPVTKVDIEVKINERDEKQSSFENKKTSEKFQTNENTENTEAKGIIQGNEINSEITFHLESGQETISNIKSSFSLSSNEEEINYINLDQKERETEIIQEEILSLPKFKRFEREQSIPELLEHLVKANTTESKEIQVTNENAELKTSKFKTLWKKVLKKKKNTADSGNYIRSFEYHEHRIDYESTENKFVKPKRTRNNGKSSNNIITKSVDYEKLLQIREPQEINKHSIEESTFLRTQKDQLGKIVDENIKLNETITIYTENEIKDQNKERNEKMVLEENKTLALEDLVEFNPESVNEIFTNLLQGKLKMPRKNSEGKQSNVPGNINSNVNPIFSMMENMNNLFGNSTIISNGPSDSNDRENNAEESRGIVNNPIDMIMQGNISNMFGNLLQQKEIPSSNQTKKRVTIENLMSTMFPMVNSLNIEHSDSNQSIPQDDNGLQTMIGQLGCMFSELSKTTDPSESSPLQNMASIFDQIMSPNNKTIENGENTNLEIIDLNKFPLFGKTENFNDILQMGEMIFGKNPFDTETNEKKLNDTETNPKTDSHTNKGKDIEAVKESEENIDTDDDVKRNIVSKNVYQDERTSVLLKQLLGEEFWSIKRKRTDLIIHKEENKQKNNSKRIKTNQINIDKNKKLNFENLQTKKISIETGIQNESPFVQKLHKRIQNDTKLQKYLKEKLQKDPKMQKFIKDKLQKDEKLQKFIRERLAKDKNLRKTFEEKFENELGLTGIIPKFEDDLVEDNDIEKKRRDYFFEKIEAGNSSANELVDDSSGTVSEHKERETSTGSNKSNGTTKILMKKYAELTFIMCGIVYMGLMCY